jgi:hypothetical protein
MVIIRRSITRKSVLDSGSARAFTSEASSAAWDGAVGAGGRIGLAARSFRTTTFSITMVSTAGDLEAVVGLEAAGVSGRTIPGTGWGFLTPVMGWQTVSSERPVRAGDSPVGRLADGRILAAT